MNLSKTDFQTTVEAMPIPCAINSLLGKITYLNPAFVRVFGYTLSDIPSVKAWRRQAYPEPIYREWVSDIWHKRIIAAREGRTPFEAVEIRIRAKTGKTHTVIATAAPIAGSWASEFLVTFTDISEIADSRKDFEALAVEHESVVMSVPVGIYKWRVLPSGKSYFDFVSPRWLDQLGLDEDTVYADSSIAFKVIHPDDVHEFQEKIGIANQAHEEFFWEGRCLRDGVERWVRIHSLPSRQENGDIVWIGIQEDITDRKRLDAELLTTKVQLELALTGSELGTWSTEVETGNSHFDRNYCAMLGYDISELEHRMDTWLSLVHPDDKQGVEDAIESHLAGRTRVFEVEHRLRHKDGHWVWFLARGKVFRDGNGRPTQATGTLLDITERTQKKEEGVELLRKIEAFIIGVNKPSKGFEDESRMPPTRQSLSPRHREVLQLLAGGMTSSQIARKLNISAGTVMAHRRNLMRKLDLHSAAELTRFALRNNIVED